MIVRDIFKVDFLSNAGRANNQHDITTVPLRFWQSLEWFSIGCCGCAVWRTKSKKRPLKIKYWLWAIWMNGWVFARSFVTLDERFAKIIKWFELSIFGAAKKLELERPPRMILDQQKGSSKAMIADRGSLHLDGLSFNKCLIETSSPPSDKHAANNHQIELAKRFNLPQKWLYFLFFPLNTNSGHAIPAN